MRALVKDIVTELIDDCACAHVSDVWQLQACAVLDTAQLRVFKLFLQPVTKFCLVNYISILDYIFCFETDI